MVKSAVAALMALAPVATTASHYWEGGMMMGDLNLTISGSSASTSCPGSISDGDKCALDGSDNYNNVDLTYHKATGKFRGTVTTNLCSNDNYGYCALCDPPGYTGHQHTAQCTAQELPAPLYEYGPSGAPLRGRVGLSVHGVNIYGPEEAGFGIGNNPEPCTDDSGVEGICYAGTDVPTCEYALEVTCGNVSKVQHSLMLDTCGGHAMPYHYHNDLACDYDHTLPSHSPIIGWALDGYGIYGLYEAYDSDTEEQLKPDDLDTCNGHVAGVPANATYGIETSEVYHYHVTSWAPYTLGCFGPVSSQDQCKALYNDTSSAQTGACAVNGGDLHFIRTPEEPDGYCYDTDCPCFDGRMSRYGRNSDEDVANCQNDDDR